MTELVFVGFKVDPELIDLARKTVPDAAQSDVVRIALARLAGVDPEQYTPKRKRPRRRGKPQGMS